MPDQPSCPWCGAEQVRSNGQHLTLWRCGSLLRDNKAGAKPKQSDLCRLDAARNEIAALTRQNRALREALAMKVLERMNNRQTVCTLCRRGWDDDDAPTHGPDCLLYEGGET